MLNYIKAELYKAVRRKYLWIFLLVMLVLEALFALMWVGRREFAELVALMTTTMGFGPFLTVLLSDIVVADPYRTGTLKNEVSFGYSRPLIYLGKLGAAMLMALAFCTALFLWYLGGCWIFSGHSDPEAIRANLGILAYVTAASLPLWLGTMGLSVACFMMIRNGTAAAAGVLLFLSLGTGLLELLTGIQVGPVSQMAKLLLNLIPTARFGVYQGALTWSLMAEHWAIGLGWLVVSSALGLAVFQRREIR